MSNIYSIQKNNYYPGSTSLANDNTKNAHSVFADFERKMVPATKSVIYNPEIKEGRKRSIIIKSSIVAALLGLTLSLASKKVRFNVLKTIKSIQLKNNSILERAKDSVEAARAAHRDVPFFTSVKISLLRGVERVGNGFFNVLGNIDHFKNKFSGDIAENVPLVGRGIKYVNGKLTPFFKGTVTKASQGRYGKAETAAKQLQTMLDDLVNSTNSSQLKKLLGNSGDDILRTVQDLNKPDAIAARLDELNKLLKDAVKKYNSEIKGMVGNSNIAQTAGKLTDSTISLELAKKELLPVHLKLLKLQRAVSFNHKEKMAVLDELLDVMYYTRGTKPSASLINKVSSAKSSYDAAIKTFYNTIGKGKNLTPATAKELKQSLNASKNELIKALKEAAKTSKDNPEILNKLASAESAVMTTKVGSIDRAIRRIDKAYKIGLIDKNTYAALNKQISSIQSKTTRAVNFEKNNLAGRFLDISIGPVPFLESTSLVIPVAALSNEIVEAENKEERISKSIVYAPTILGGLGATIGALKMGLFGVQALLFGAGTGFIFNRIGTWIDNKYYSKGREFNTIKVLSQETANNPGVKIYEM